MDGRLAGLLEKSLNIKPQEAVFIKNAGNIIINNSIDNDTIRSLLIAIFTLGCKEIAVVGHSNCRMVNVDGGLLKQRMLEMGIEKDIVEREVNNDTLGVFLDIRKNIEDTVLKLRDSKLIPSCIPIHGLLIDLEDGAIKKILTA